MEAKLIGITSKLLQENDEATWCSTTKLGSNPGDKILIYVKGIGISQLYEIINSGNRPDNIKCLSMAMNTIYLRHINTFGTPLTSATLKQTPELSKISVVRKNFQGTTFTLTNEEWELLIKELNQLNPNFIYKP